MIEEEVVATAVAAARAVVNQSDRLGLTWQLRPGTVVTSPIVALDGDPTAGTTVNVVPLQGPFAPGERIMCLLIPETGLIYGIGRMGNLPVPGSLVARLRQASAQTFTNGGQDFIDFDTVEYDPYGGFNLDVPDRWTFPFAGIFQLNGRIVWASNATSRRFCGVNVNGTTSGTGTRGGSSLQAPATGTCQLQALGSYSAVSGEYCGVRGIQNSGGDLLTAPGTDGGCVLEVVYLGQDIS